MLVAYAYIGYPLAIALLARLRPRPVRGAGEPPRSVSIVVTAYNEAATIGRRVREFLDILGAGELDGELIVVSDGSSDLTAEMAAEQASAHPAGERCKVLALAENAGKASALTAGCSRASKEIIAFADSRQTWDPAALGYLLENFADPDVGAVSGDLVVESAPGVMQGVGLYWRYEKWLRHNEGRVGSMVGATGAISAVRRSLFRAIPARTILDDVYWPLRVVLDGRRVVHDPRAKAFDRLPERARAEFRRKVRTLSGNYQLLFRLPAAALPGSSAVWCQFISHKLLRLLVPWALIAMFLLNVLLYGAPGGLMYRGLLVGQLAGYSLGLLGLFGPIGARLRPASAASSFLVLNAAAWVAFWVWAFGRTGNSWNKTTYSQAPAGRSAQGPDRDLATPGRVVGIR